ncbi:unnamed protein product [Rhodiola kirilowii]
MKLSTTFLLLLIVSSGVSCSPVQGVHIPEHTCHKVISGKRCDQKKCSQSCSKEPGSAGICTSYNTVCICIYFCWQPPN